MSILNKQISVKTILIPLILCLVAIAFMAAGCTDPSQSSINGQQTAIQKWGQPGNGITTFYEYQQMQAIYTLRDNPQLILNAYLYSQQTGQLTCLGKVKGFGIPYGTQMSPPSNGTQPVPEPNSLYPSQNTNADWVQLIDPTTGKVTIAFVEPELLITSQSLPCTLLKGTTNP